MSISKRLTSWLALLVVLAAVALVPATGVVAHDGSIQHLAQKHFHTKAVANDRFVIERWAVVDAAGSLVRGERVVSAARLGEGIYSVEFNRDVSQCAYSVTAYAENGGLPIRIASVSTGGDIPADDVVVGMYNTSGFFSDAGFSLVLSC